MTTRRCGGRSDGTSRPWSSWASTPSRRAGLPTTRSVRCAPPSRKSTPASAPSTACPQGYRRTDATTHSSTEPRHGMRIIDADTHLIETRTLWADHLDTPRKDLAMRIVDDDLGWSWLTTPDGRRVHLAESHTPGDVAAMGRRRERQRRGLPPEPGDRFDDAVPAYDRDPDARLAKMDEHGTHEAVVFPNFGLFWPRSLDDAPAAQLANMQAWNRWAVGGIAATGDGRLHPVGHVSLRDPGWLDHELSALAGAGVRGAMVPIGPVDGKAFSHPDLDGCWSAFEHHDVAVVF